MQKPTYLRDFANVWSFCNFRADIQSEKTLRQVNVAGGFPGTPIASSEAEAGAAGGTPTRGSRRGRSSRGGETPSEIVPPSETSDAAAQLVVWGTDVSVAQVKSKFRKFVETFIPSPTSADGDEMMEADAADNDDGTPLYLQKLEEVSGT
jgi:hypothetical protein